MKEDVVKEIALETIRELEETHIMPFPYYYARVFNSIYKDKDITISDKYLLKNVAPDEILLEKTSHTVDSVKESNDSIEKVSNDFFQEVCPKQSVDKIMGLVTKFEKELVDELNKSNTEINQLKKELESAYKKLNSDQLTKTLNRRALETDLEKITEAGKNKTLDMSIAIFDIDDFKEINDQYGHIIGDKVLIVLTGIVKNSIREYNKMYRYGGDEFVIVFNRMCLKEVKDIMMKVVEKVDKSLFKFSGHSFKTSISVGVSCHESGDMPNELIERADKALYETKKNGKNAMTVNYKG